MKKLITRFVDSVYFQILLGIITLTGWLTNQSNIAAAFFVVLSVFVLFSTDSRSFISLLVFPIIMQSQSPIGAFPPTGLLLMYTFIIIEIFIYLCLQHEKIYLGRYFYSLIILFLVFLFSLLIRAKESGKFDMLAFLYLFVLLFIAVVYIFFNSTLHHEKLIESFGRMMIVIGTIITIQVFTYFIRNPGHLGLDDTLYVGWGNSNSAGLILLICFIFSFSHFKFKKEWYLGLLSLPMLVGLFFTQSRGVIYSTVVGFILLLIFTFLSTKKKSKIIIYSLTFITVGTVIAVSFIFKAGPVYTLIHDLIESGFDNNGRDVIYQEILAQLKVFTYFGPSASFLTDFPGNTPGNLFLCHNTFLTTAALGGCVGIVFLLGHYINVYSSLIFSKKYRSNLYRVPVLIFLITLDIEGMVDNTFLNAYFMIFYVCILAVMEASSRTNTTIIEQKYFLAEQN